MGWHDSAQVAQAGWDDDDDGAKVGLEEESPAAAEQVEWDSAGDQALGAEEQTPPAQTIGEQSQSVSCTSSLQGL